MESHTCGKCGIEWAAPERWWKDKRENGDTFYCPNGHPRVFSESVSDKLRRERDQLKQQIARVEDEKRAAQAETEKAIAAKKRLEKRINAGVCPCCTRSFTNMARHMKTKHPEFAGSVVPLKAAKARP